MMPNQYSVDARRRQPLVDYICNALTSSGCKMVKVPNADRAPFIFVFETADGVSMGLVAYAFFANRRQTVNRPEDEWRFQIKYGSKDGQYHELWQDENRLFTTILVGIDPDSGLWVAADPILHSPTRFFISLEFKDHQAESALQTGWAMWERSHRTPHQPLDVGTVETMIAGRSDTLLRLIQFERASLGLGPGDRLMLARNFGDAVISQSQVASAITAHPHELERLLGLSHEEILDLIQSAPRLLMPVRGWVAQEHLFRHLSGVPGITDLEPIEQDGRPDLQLRYQGSEIITIECKNVRTGIQRRGNPVVDFQRTRASKADPCSRYYRTGDFDIVAACLAPVTQVWQFEYRSTFRLLPHSKCEGRLAPDVVVEDWTDNIVEVLGEVIHAHAK